MNGAGPAGTECPHFERCSAPICPLDPGHLAARHLDGERVCYWLTEAVKDGGEANLRAGLGQDVADKVLTALPAIVARYGPIRRQLRRSAHNPPRIRKTA